MKVIYITKIDVVSGGRDPEAVGLIGSYSDQLPEKAMTLDLGPIRR